MRLLGEWHDGKYHYSTEDFLIRIEALIRYANNKSMAMAYWSKLDPFVILRTFLESLDPYDDLEQINQALDRFGEVGGKWNKKERKWDARPVVEIKGNGFSFGILGVIRSAIQFFHLKDIDDAPNTVWAYDIKGLYQQKRA